jgi:hypothetical protein
MCLVLTVVRVSATTTAGSSISGHYIASPFSPQMGKNNQSLHKSKKKIDMNKLTESRMPSL